MSTDRPDTTSPARREDTGSSATEVRTARGDQTSKNAVLGTAQAHQPSNVSWGAIFGGVVTFLALTVVLSLGSAALGLDGATGATTGIWTLVALAIALAVAGFVAGALANRAGLLHGFLTWAGSLLAVVVLAGWLGTTMLGAVGNAVGAAAQQTTVSAEQLQGATQDAQDQVTEQDQQQAQQRAAEAADAGATGLWWTFAGTLIGAGIAAATGAAGARSVARKETEVTRA